VASAPNSPAAEKSPLKSLWWLSPWYQHPRFQLARGALSADPSPESVMAHVHRVAWAWAVLIPWVGLAMIGVAYLANRIYGDTGNEIALSILAGIAAFCLTGGVDAVWRYFPARSAGRLMASNAERRTDEVAALLRTALANDGILIIQLAVGVGVAIAVGVSINA
jgi:hypothetical protein